LPRLCRGHLRVLPRPRHAVQGGRLHQGAAAHQQADAPPARRLDGRGAAAARVQPRDPVSRDPVSECEAPGPLLE